MRKSRDIKVNIVGHGSCLMLFLLLMTAVCPIAPSSAFAEETPTSTPASDTAATLSDTDAGIMPAADTGVTITFSPTTGSASLTPTTADGSLAKIDVTANVKIASTGGYTIYLGGRNAALTGTKTGATIPGATTATTFNNMKTNTWGYAYAEGSSVPDSATYAALPQGQGKSLKSVSGNNTNINHTYALSFATKIGNDKPADTYSNQVTLSVTSSPLEVTGLTSLTDIQEMTSEVCETSEVGDTKQLRDVRDGKYYWVAKLKDNNCWMTQDLKLDLSTNRALTSSDSDVTNDWTPAFTTATQASSSTILNDSTSQRSWNLGDYIIVKPTETNDCGSRKSGLSQCASQFQKYSMPVAPNEDESAHYIVGNYYAWNAATAGTGATITSGQASSSICPKGWKLPTSNTNNVGSLGGLLNKFSIINNATGMTSLTSSPLYFVRGGYVAQDTSYLLSSAGGVGRYWSSTPASTRNDAYTLAFDNTNYISPSATNSRSAGRSVRCVAR